MLDQRQQQATGQAPFKVEEATDRAIRDRNLFEKKTLLQKEARKAFAEVMNEEYQMLRLYRPRDLVLAHAKQQFSQEVAEASQQKVKIDRKRLSDADYLRSLKNDAGSKEMQTISGHEYVQLELEKTDLFLFVKYVTPSTYKRHFGDAEDDQEEERTATESDTYAS